jgi:hypothetical protein
MIIALMPLPFLRDALLAKHASGCARCGEDLADVREAKSVTWAGADFGGKLDFWPRFEAAVRRPGIRDSASRRHSPRWRWAVASATAVGLAAAGLLLLDFERKNGQGLPPGIKFVIKSSTVYDEPAQAFIFQTQDEHTTFAWVEKQSAGEQP